MADLYEVVYIDKFEDITEATVARESLKSRFGLNDHMLSTLSSGVPVVVKKNVDLEEARRFEQAIKDSGGVCWVQEMAPDGRFHERRLEQRRKQQDRRHQVRGSAIVPDRRSGKGRRTLDPH
ncbi:hypothetical protein HBA55_26970 [Pseudomaricurvus alkylphenolicus]|uniref:hypothetical protein n=1 Tax=Pseudomaricurvus alkylphenolicus TaxID=1306991 RepID=UPI001421BD6B|nr:hypothetical protein [Pseudomaricurvus alkylphenolicus]NIB43279.1 hypothetical protein [Pseudomaricurvus alkylphenolicus]